MGRVWIVACMGAVLGVVNPVTAQAPGDAAKAVAPEVRTESGFAREYHTFLSEAFLKVFDAAHPSPTPDDAAARQFVAGVPAHMAWQWSKTLGRQDAVFGTHEMVKRKYDDPMLLLAAGYYLIDWDDHRIAAERLRDLAKRFPETPEGWLVRVVTAQRYATALADIGSTKRQGEAAEEGADAVVAAVRSGIFKDRSRFLVALLYDTIDNEVWPAATVGSMCDKLEALAEVDPWLIQMLRGMVEIELAWNDRGSGFAHTVTDEGWEGFRVHLEKAREHLTKAYALDPTRPEPAVCMITVAMAGHAAENEDERFWFDRAKKAEMGNWRAYGGMRWALRPRWGGSLSKLYDFGMECAASRRFDTCVPFQYIMTLKDLGDETEDLAAVLEAPGALENAKRVLTAYLENPEETIAWGRARCDLIVIHWAAGEYKEARKQLEIYGSNPKGNELNDWGIELTPAAFVDDINLLSSPAAKHVLKGDRLVEEEDFAGATKAYETAVQEIAELDAETSLALRRRLELARVTQGVITGEPTTIKFMPGVPGWGVYTSTWNAREDGGIDMEARANSPLIRLKMDIGERYEVSARVEIPEQPGMLVNAGIVVGLGENRNKSKWHAATISTRGKARMIYVGARDIVARGQTFTKTLPTQPAYDLVVKVWDEQMWVYVDGKFMFGGHVEIKDEKDELEWGPRFGLGVMGSRVTGKAGFSNVQVKRLSEAPAELAQAQVLKHTPLPKRTITPKRDSAKPKGWEKPAEKQEAPVKPETPPGDGR